MLKKCLSNFKGLVIFYISNGVVQIVAAGMAVVFFQRLIDSISSDFAISGSLMFLVIYGGLEITDELLSYLGNYPYSKLKNGIYYYLKTEAIKKIAVINFLSYRKYGTGELVQLIENGATAGRDILFNYYLSIFQYLLPSVVVGIVIIGFYDTAVLLSIIGSYVVVFIITKLLLKKLYAVKNKSLINEEKFSSRAVRAFMELIVFRIGGKYKREIELCEETAGEITKSRTNILMTHELFFTLFAVMVTLIKAGAILIGISQIIKGEGTVGEIFAVVIMIERIYTPIAIFNVKYVDFKLNKAAFERFRRLLEEKEDENLLVGNKLELKYNKIGFCDVNFKYGDSVLLNGLSFNLIKGTSYAFIGSSGAGKTTVLNMIAGLLKPDCGRIEIDNFNLNNIKLDEYYKSVEYITQTPAVFDGSVRENLVLNQEIDDEKLIHVLKQVNLYSRLAISENGLDEMVGERGCNLSGGEKQRLAAARIMLQKPAIILLDEPTGALDQLNEELLIKCLVENLHDCIIITVTHKKKIMDMFDVVIDLKDVMNDN